MLLHYLLTFALLAKALTEYYVNAFYKLFGKVPHSQLPLSLDGKTVIITGANRGVGLEIAKTFAKLGAKTIMCCRDMTLGQESHKQVIEEIDEEYCTRVFLVHLDLASFSSIERCVIRIRSLTPKVDYLINCAGIMMCPSSVTEDGFEMQFGVNYLGHFLFTQILLDLLLAAAPFQARIINVSSIAHNAGFIHWNNINLNGDYHSAAAYGQSKLAIILATLHASKLYQTTNLRFFSVHPGLVNTSLWKRTNWPGLATAQRIMSTVGFLDTKQGCQTIFYCCFDERALEHPGGYFKFCRLDNNMTRRVNTKDAERLWSLSMQMCGFVKE